DGNCSCEFYSVGAQHGAKPVAQVGDAIGVVARGGPLAQDQLQGGIIIVIDGGPRDEQVAFAATAENVAAKTADEDVSARAAIEDVSSVAADQQILAAASGENIIARAAPKHRRSGNRRINRNRIRSLLTKDNNAPQRGELERTKSVSVE